MFKMSLYPSGANNVHLHQLRSILITYSAYHTDVGYAQGMNDLAARFLSVLDSEVCIIIFVFGDVQL